jgi:hypothetical protein
MFFRKLDCELVQNLFSVSLKSSIESSITINYNKTERRLIDEQLFFEIIKIKFRVAIIDRKIDGLKWLKVTNKLSFSSRILIHDFTCEEN